MIVPPPTPNRPAEGARRGAIARWRARRHRGAYYGASAPLRGSLSARPHRRPLAVGALLRRRRHARADRRARAGRRGAEGDLAAARRGWRAATRRVACISGRAAADARRLVGVGGIAYAGSTAPSCSSPDSSRPRVDARLRRAGRAAVQALRARSATRPSCARCASGSRTRGRSWPSTGAARPTRRPPHAPRAADRLARRRPRAWRPTGAARCSRSGRRCRSTRARPCASCSSGRRSRAALYAGDDVTDLDAFDALDALVEAGELDDAVTRRRALRRGPAEIVERRRPRRRRRRRHRSRCSRSSTRREVPRLPARVGAAVRRRPRRRSPSSRSSAPRARTRTRSSTWPPCWWCVAVLAGLWLGRRLETTEGIAPPARRGAQHATRCPSSSPATVLFNRLWPLSAWPPCSRGAIGFFFPQVPAVATGYCLLVALLWRQQSRAVEAIEGRDGVEFWFDRSSPFGPPAAAAAAGPAQGSSRPSAAAALAQLVELRPGARVAPPAPRSSQARRAVATP